MSGNSLINLGELSKPATVLIEKICDAVGGIFKPYQIVRIAKADAEAERIRAESQIEISHLQRRAMYRFLEEEAKKQANIEDITRNALPLLNAGSEPGKVEDDWITNFFDKCRIISDHDMQVLWSRILAGEANSPGTFSKGTVNLLANLDKSDAELFVSLCGYVWNIGPLPIPLVIDVEHDVYKRGDLSFYQLSHLESLGLIRYDTLSEFQTTRRPKRVQASYFGRAVELTLQNETDNVLTVGKVILTRAGMELAPICGSQPVEGFFEYVYDVWAKASYVPAGSAAESVGQTSQ